jgi:hypothetical protein
MVLVKTVGSSPELRSDVRERLASLSAIRAIFLLGRPAGATEGAALRMEAALHGDILMGDLQEDYNMMTYKIMLGLLWIDRWCANTTKHVVNIDDNAVVDFSRLLDVLERTEVRNSIVCPNVMRNLHVWRHKEAPMMGKWAVEAAAWPARTYPAHCNGWLWVTTPAVGRALAAAAAGLTHERDVPGPGGMLDDTFTTGYIRHQLGWVQVQPLQPINIHLFPGQILE